ncbi:hypothetical protein [Umezawaea tangerina]|uniref:Uncharacterized protein n=1 Tax=Umezawaea tangerina TaxID=84725 RepID=A0A2T0SNU4_9PSEU|nr:hypothetical protein [Umezawaea tangerina]PRY35087.1 hypothetical protein CLV43_1145 [Umezawaea tangerina]
MLTTQVVWLIGLVLGLGAVMTLVGHVNVLLAFGLPVAVVIAILGAIGIGRATNTMYRDVLAFFQQGGNDGRGTP